MTDVLDQLARRNPVGEAAMPARDERGVSDLSRIMAVPVPAGRAPRRRAGRPLRLALGVAGIAGIAVLIGGLFLVTPRGPRPAAPPAPPGPPQAPIPARDLVATIRVEPHPAGPSLEQATRRAADILNARAAALAITGAKATVAGPGRIRFLVPDAGSPNSIRSLLEMRPWAVHDLGRTLLGDSRDRRAAIRALEGDPTAPRGEPYTFTNDSWYVTNGAAGGQGFPARTVRPQAGRIAVPADPLGLPGPNLDLPGFSFVVLRDEPVAHAADVESAEVSGGLLTVRLRTPTDVRGRLILVVNQWIFASASPGRGRSRTLVLPLAPDDRAEFKRVLTGGGLDAELILEETRPAGRPRVRTGQHPVVTPRMRVRLLEGIPLRFDDGTTPVPVPATLLRVIGGTDRFGQRWNVWEVLTTQGDALVMQETDGTISYDLDCVISWAARIIRSCGGGSDPVASGVVAPEVAKVVVRRADGTVTPAILRNGWFFTGTPTAKGSKIVALDEDGNVLAQIPDPRLGANPFTDEPQVSADALVR